MPELKLYFNIKLFIIVFDFTIFSKEIFIFFHLLTNN